MISDPISKPEVLKLLDLCGGYWRTLHKEYENNQYKALVATAWHMAFVKAEVSYEQAKDAIVTYALSTQGTFEPKVSDVVRLVRIKRGC